MEYRTKQPENLSSLQRFGRWLRLKQYQIEVTFGVYMFTPTEKFLFWSVVFLLCGLLLIATILYLPQHVLFIINRAWFYVNGGDSSVASNVVAGNKDALSLATSSATTTLAAAATETAERMSREL
ncbi:uncharacterized protein GGS25DRAFT_275454 [Hypoxylon fragiforme]|uniref:uncharacterized protein n=1 Tax=Hypoxylon fragiforme TaxID=63214 RepID=UPI0020C67F5A|nr:uncharacterized protein GGS25DRAFT_275454 [Hypoxylon fragiforme]KAI2608424.1 hypothetical protein GGS25DRAFT_275454 [Hypoxylon fragiforme]